ncbi:MAG: rhomboid family intramembrane serine protease [Deinococcaceae bacterium]
MFSELDHYLWIWVAVALAVVAFGQRVRELRYRLLAVSATSLLSYFQPFGVPFLVIAILQAVFPFWVAWRIPSAHPHLLKWISWGIWTSEYKTILQLAWLECAFLRNRPCSVQLSPLQPWIEALILKAQRPSVLTPPDSPIEKGYAAWISLEFPEMDVSMDPLWRALLTGSADEVRLAARKLGIPHSFWVARALFLQGQSAGDASLMQFGAQEMLGQVNRGLPWLAWRHLEVGRLLKPYGLTVEPPASPVFPWATAVVFGVILVFFVWQNRLSQFDFGEVLVYLGGNWTPFTLDGEPWRLLTAAFLHAGVVHMGFNSFYLITIGTPLERRVGPGALLLVFVLSALGGSLLSAYAGGDQRLSVGASGAIFGWFALSAVVGTGSLQERFERLLRALPNLGLMLALGFLLPNVDNWAHLGGLLVGVVLGLAYQVPRRFDQLLFAAIALSVLGWSVFELLRWQTQHPL